MRSLLRKHWHKRWKKIRTKLPTRRKLAVYAGAVVLLAAVGGYYLLAPYFSSAAWFDSAWLYRKKIILDKDMVSGTGDLSDFPVLVRLTDADLSSAQASGGDILFTGANGSSQLDHDIESFNQSTGELIAWVEIPTLSASADTTIYIYFGNAAAANQENESGTWSNGYEGVYHLHDDFLNAEGTAGRDGTNYGSSDVAGFIGDAQDFETSESDRISIGNWSVSGSAITLQAWVKYESFADDDSRILAKANGVSDNAHVYMMSTDNGGDDFRFRLKTGTNDGSGTTTLLQGSGAANTTDTWYQVAMTYDGSAMRIIRNGEEVASTDKTGALRENSWNINIGANGNNASFIDAIIDEVRISSVYRDADWLTTEYNNQRNPEGYMTVYSLEGDDTAPEDWYNASWAYRKTVTVDNSMVSGSSDLTDFPVLVSVTDTDLTKAQVDGDDLVFTSADGLTKLNHEIESFNQSTGELIAWVRIPTLSHNTNTTLYLYYGNETAASNQNPEAVWGDSHRAVYHMDEDPSISTDGSCGGGDKEVCDSSGYGNNADSQAGMTAADAIATGKIGAAINFDGNSNDRLTTNVESLSDFTIETWIYGTAFSNNHNIWADGTDNGPEFDSSNTLTYWTGTGGSFNTTFSTDTWYHVVITQTGGNATFYLNGESDGSASGKPDIALAQIGNDSFNEGFIGNIDEFRVSTDVRSADWIRTTYRTQNDPASYITLGEEEVYEVTVTIGPYWYNEAWRYRKTITIKENKVSGTINLTNFPVVISRQDSDLKDYAQTSGNDILFTSSDGTTQLDHEIESYDSSTGTLVAWVEVPTLYAEKDTTLYMYYGNPEAANQQDVTGVWSENDLFVHHLEEDPATAGTDGILDSSVNANHGTDFGSMDASDQVTAQLNGGMAFDGSNDYIAIDSDASLAFTQNDSRTFSFWFEKSTNCDSADSTNNEVMLSRYGNGHTFATWWIGCIGYTDGTYPNRMIGTFYDGNGNNTAIYSNQAFNDGTLHHISIVYDAEADTLSMYIDGQLNGSAVATNFAADFPSASPVCIGGYDQDCSSNYLSDVTLDHVKITATSRSADWIATEYNNQSSPGSFMSFSQQTKAPAALYWTMDDGYGTTLRDSSENSFSGTIQGPSWTGNDLCIHGTCLTFNGTTDQVRRDYSGDDETDPGTGPFSVSSWFRRDIGTPRGEEVLISRYAGGGYRVYMNATGNVCFAIDDDATFDPDDVACSSASYNDGKWHHVEAVKRDTGIYIFVDGRQMGKDESLSATGSLSGNSPTFYVGSTGIATTDLSRTVGSNGDDGYEEKDSFDWSPDNCYLGTENSALTSDLYCGMRFRNITISRPAIINSATITYIADNTNSNPTSVDAVIRAQDTDNASQMSDTNLPSLLTYTSAGVNFDPAAWSDGTEYTSPDVTDIVQEVLDRPGWQSGNALNVVWIPRDTNPINTYLEMGDVTNGAPATLNINYTATNWGYLWNGSVDEVKIYTYDRTVGEIQVDYNRGAGRVGGGNDTDTARLPANGLAGYWQMDEASWNGATDEVVDGTGHDNHGTRAGDATTAVGYFGRAGTFDGTGDYITVTNHESLQATNGMSIAAWVFPDANASTTVVSKDNSYRLTTTASGNPQCEIYDGSTWQLATGSAALSVSGWQQVGCSYDRNEISVYQDGDRTGVATASAAINIDTSELRIGSDASGTYNAYDGLMDEVRVYASGITSYEIENLYTWKPDPVAYYPLNEDPGSTTFYDRSGNGYHGSANGTLTSDDWQAGVLGYALDLDGTDDFIEIGNGPGSVHSVSFWVKPTTTTEPLVNIAGTTAFISATAGTISATGFTSPTIYVDGSLSSTLTAGQWQHVVVTTTTPVNATNLELGRTEDTTYLTGQIDDVRLFNFALEDTDVQQLYIKDKPLSSIDVQLGTMVNYAFEETSGTIAGNTIDGGSIDGTLVNFAEPATVDSGWTSSGKTGRALQFDGADDYVNTNITTHPDAYTIAFWMKPDNFGENGFGRLIEKETTSGTTTIRLFLSDFNDRLNFSQEFTTDQGEWHTPNNSIQTGVWQHVAISYNNEALNDPKIYIDGSEVNVSELDTPSGTAITNSDPFLLGSNYDTSRAFDGTFDDVKIYDYQLSDGEVEVLAGVAPPGITPAIGLDIGTLGTTSDGKTPSDDAARGYCPPGSTHSACAPIGAWNFEERSGTTVSDSSANSATYTGTWNGTGTKRWVAGKYGAAVNFNGTDDYLDFGDIEDRTNGTVTFWVRPDTAITSGFTSTVGLWGKYNNNDNQYYLAFQGSDYSGGVGSAGNLIFKAERSGSAYMASSINSWDANTWYHIALTWNGTKTDLYVDGVLEDTDTFSKPLDGTDIERIGAAVFEQFNVDDGTASTTRYFDGSIDSFRVYNYAMDPAQVAWDMNRGAPTGHWKMDEGDGTGTEAVHDASGNAYHGSTQGSMTNADWVAGKYNGALDFDGTDDYVDMGDVSIVDGATEMSVCAWINYDPVSVSDAAIVGEYNNGASGWTMFVDQTGSAFSGSNILSFSVSPLSGTSGQVEASDNSITSGEWQHFCGVFKGGSYLRIYKDGVLNAENTTSIVTAVDSTTTPLRIGSWDISRFDGKIDDVRIYPYALTDIQVRLVQNQGSAVQFVPFGWPE